MHEWDDFFVATSGASAALTGLIFVGISISLTKILSFATLPTRALISLVLLLTILMASLIVLIPGQTTNSIGVEVLVVGILSWAGITVADIKAVGRKDPEYKSQQVLITLIDQFALIPYIIPGIRIITVGAPGIYWIVPGIFLCFIKAVMDAWVLLVEINR